MVSFKRSAAQLSALAGLACAALVAADSSNVPPFDRFDPQCSFAGLPCCPGFDAVGTRCYPNTFVPPRLDAACFEPGPGALEGATTVCEQCGIVGQQCCPEAVGELYGAVPPRCYRGIRVQGRAFCSEKGGPPMCLDCGEEGDLCCPDGDPCPNQRNFLPFEVPLSCVDGVCVDPTKASPGGGSPGGTPTSPDIAPVEAPPVDASDMAPGSTADMQPGDAIAPSTAPSERGGYGESPGAYGYGSG